ncbi:ATP-binding cassette domain-containing protein [Haematospirillum sp. 15-248]|uniref:peptidase domain-containing ABC transporter n=1 Tax=Haematospirillum sp. 15-248 TaxID=2723107 RepID=UPI00143AB7D1|nr:ATP-binding cassette domain-containing protein [Haematospirillum sp. 15-248]NKD87854.1 ATP-binding cassette domain-containing protein [Haematospirillum sp. 15-248]
MSVVISDGDVVDGYSMNKGIGVRVSPEETGPDATGAGPVRYRSRPLELPDESLLTRNDLGLCLPVLLRALGWDGDTRHLVESLPYFGGPLDLTGLRRTMVDLGFSSVLRVGVVSSIPDRELPCLFLPDDADACVVLSREHDGLHVFMPGYGVQVIDDVNPGVALVFQAIEDPDARASSLREGSWLGGILMRFRPHLWIALALTAVITLLAITSPLYVMAIYDRYISSGSLSTLGSLVLVMIVALTGELGARSLRTRLLARVGARIDILVGRAVFERLLYLPPSVTEGASVGAQVSRVKDFDTVREFLTGQSAQSVLDVPFSVLVIASMYILAGWLGLVPTIGALVLVAMGFLAREPLRRQVAEAARATSNRQELAIEAVRLHRLLRTTGAFSVWLNRYRIRSARAAQANFGTNQTVAFLAVAAQGVVMLCGVATLWFGAVAVLAGVMSTGGLIASMILLWRALAPFQAGFMVLARSEQVHSSIRQIDRLMEMIPERPPHALVRPVRELGGSIQVSRFSLRYSQDSEPALLGVSFEVKPGEVVAVVGRNGAGKSTLIKALAGVLKGQTGMVKVDGMDIRRFDPLEYRRVIAWCPEEPEIFRGTVIQNIQLADPSASLADIQEVAGLVGLADDLRELPDGLETRFGDQKVASPSVRTRIALARVLMRKDAPIVLLDEPAGGLDAAGDEALMNVIRRLQGRVTVVVVTHRPSHVRLADKLLELRDGQVVRFVDVESLTPSRPTPPVEQAEKSDGKGQKPDNGP